MRLRVAIANSALAFALLLLVPAARLRAQYQPPSEKLQIVARTAATWAGQGEDVIQLEGPVTIETDRARLSAQRAVLWLRPLDRPEAPPGARKVDVILVGDAEVAHNGTLRTGPRLAVTAEVAGQVTITAEDRRAADLSQTPQYLEAAALRRQALPAPQTRPATGPATRGADAEPEPTPVPAKNVEPVRFVAPGNIDIDTNYTVDNKVTAVITGGITLVQHQENGDLLEMQAERAVIFTTLDSMKDTDKLKGVHNIEDAVSGAYLEGDVRVVYTPVPVPGVPTPGEHRFRARRIFYDFTTDRAIFTDVVLHTTEPDLQIPITLRAKVVRQLSKGEFAARRVELSTSSFALPSYSIAADSVYVREVRGEGPDGGRTDFKADNARFHAFGLPAFWLPTAGGEVGRRAIPLRSASVIDSSRFGYGATTEWGLFETFGNPPPQGVDARYKLDYFSDRGPAAGLDAEYQGGFVTETSKQRWAFTGDLQSYFVYDKGTDNIGRLPTREGDPQEMRGQALFRHQHFFPGDWQVQLRLGYLSDPTFLEQWSRRQFWQGEERDVSLYVKHQRDTEAQTFLVDVQPNDLVTTSDMMQEQFEVERLPEFGYHRIGDGVEFGRGQFPTSGVTFISDNSASGLRFNRTGATLREQGFPEDGSNGPGIPSLGQTGTPSDVTYRADFRQEVDFPFSLGQFRLLPYLVGRYTAYSESPDGGAENRFFGAAGARVSTAFWRVDENVESRILDLHRMRHLIEPELNLFTAGTTVDRDHLLLYDEPIDSIHDVSAVAIALRQRWQTERGAPGRRRSTDFFTLNMEASFFSNEPEKTLPPENFRGLYFASLPEASVPRESFNVDAAWRLSDTTVVLADAQWNLDEHKLATAGAGVIVQRDARMTYFVSGRRIQDLDSSILGVVGVYELSPKYSVTFSQSYDFAQSTNVASALEVRRRFDTFFISFTYTYSLIDDESGFAVNIYPTWLPFRGLDQTAFNSALRGGRTGR